MTYVSNTQGIKKPLLEKIADEARFFREEVKIFGLGLTLAMNIYSPFGRAYYFLKRKSCDLLKIHYKERADNDYCGGDGD